MKWEGSTGDRGNTAGHYQLLPPHGAQPEFCKMERRIVPRTVFCSSPTGGRNTASPLGKVFQSTHSVSHHVRSPWGRARTQHRSGSGEGGRPHADLKSPWALALWEPPV